MEGEETLSGDVSELEQTRRGDGVSQLRNQHSRERAKPARPAPLSTSGVRIRSVDSSRFAGSQNVVEVYAIHVDVRVLRISIQLELGLP